MTGCPRNLEQFLEDLDSDEFLKDSYEKLLVGVPCGAFLKMAWCQDYIKGLVLEGYEKYNRDIANYIDNESKKIRAGNLQERIVSRL